MSRHVIALLLATVLLQSPAKGADLFDYGSVLELKGVTKFYVDAGDDLDLRDIIKSRLEQLPGVKVVDRPDDAEHWVIFRWRSKERRSRAT